MISAKRKFFRHFDGYGHTTSIPFALGMGLSSFDENGDTACRRLISNISSDESFRLRTAELISAYSEIFCNNYLVLLRDIHYSRRLAGIKKTSPRQDFLKAFKIFLESQVMIDLSYLKISNHEMKKFIYLLSNNIFVRQNEFFGLICHDVDLWSVARKPIYLRALIKVNNVLFRKIRKLFL